MNYPEINEKRRGQTVTYGGYQQGGYNIRGGYEGYNESGYRQNSYNAQGGYRQSEYNEQNGRQQKVRQSIHDDDAKRSSDGRRGQYSGHNVRRGQYDGQNGKRSQYGRRGQQGRRSQYGGQSGRQSQYSGQSRDQRYSHYNEKTKYQYGKQAPESEECCCCL